MLSLFIVFLFIIPGDYERKGLVRTLNADSEICEWDT